MQPTAAAAPNLFYRIFGNPATDPGHFFVMIFILLCLVISIAVVIDRCYKYFVRYDLTNSSAFMAQIQKLVMNNSIENAIRFCKGERPRLMPTVLAEGLKRANDSTDEIENALHYAQLAAVPKVTSRTQILGTTANVATLLGLLGTLFGLMKSFAAAADATGQTKAVILAQGISEALVATTFGLGTALLCLLAYGILMLKQNAIIDDINASSARLLDLLYTRKMKIRSRADTGAGE